MDRALPLTVVFAYRRTGKFAFHVLAGALASDPRFTALPIDFANGVDAVAAAIEAARARRHRVLVGWSFYSPDFAQMAAELRAVRTRTGDAFGQTAAPRDPSVLHVVGGVHASAEPLATLRAGFDLVAIGDGEHTIRALCAGHGGGGDVRSVAGVAFLDGDRLVRTPRAPRPELDEFPPCSPWHARYGPIEITRGCVYACRFCQTPFFAGASFRHRSVANVREWVRLLAARGHRDVRFLSPTSLSYGAAGTEPELGAVEDLLAAVREEIGPERRLWFGTFPSEVRPEHVSPAALQLLQRYVTNRSLILGGQSGSDRVLAHSRRGHDVASIERAVALCIEHGFTPHVDFLFGMPGEDVADLEATLALMDRLTERGARAHGHTFLPLPGTPFRRAAPGALTPETRARLLRLASRGRLYGQWESQAGLALQLARPGDPDPPMPAEPTRLQPPAFG